MATHMVPQDVEAEDKLVGFLSLKQFIMTVVGLGFGYLTFFFFTRVHPLAALIWLPPTLAFLVLGLYQRKDQPIEVFLASAITFYFKPRKRIWTQEGHEDHVIITAPPKVEHNYTKDFTGEEAASRLNNLSIMMDSRGWASKRMSDWQNPQLATTADSENRLVQPQEAPGQLSPQQTYIQPADVMDENTSLIARDFETKISQMKKTTQVKAFQAVEKARIEPVNTGASDENIVLPEHQTYPEMHQKVVATPKEDVPEKPKTHPAPTAKLQKQLQQIDTAKKKSLEPKHTKTPKEHVTEDGSVEISLH
jgi:hypothetical protein